MGQLDQKLHEHCRDLLETGEKRDMRAFCPQCNESLDAFSKECPACGYDLREDPNARAALNPGTGTLTSDAADTVLLVCEALAGLGTVLALVWVLVTLFRREMGPALASAVVCLHSLGLAIVFHRVRGISGLFR
jgi:hypothetical protein